MLADVALQPTDVGDQITQCQHLARALVLSKEMLACARREEWQEVSRLEVARKDDLQACFSRPLESGDSPVVAEAVAALLHLNEEIAALVEQARQQLAGQNRELTRGRAAVGSYLNNR